MIVIRRIFVLFLCVLLCFALSVSVFASDLIGSGPEICGADGSYPWCVKFARWYSSEHGYPVPDTLSSTAAYKWFTQNHSVTTSPSVGDWIFFDFQNDGVLDHVGIVTAVSDSSFSSIEGNVNDKVADKQYSKNDSSVYAFGHYLPSETRVVSPVTPSNSSGLKSILITIFGNYDPVVVEYQYSNTNGYYSYLREIQPDYPFLVSAAVFAILIFCLFRFLGGVFHK